MNRNWPVTHAVEPIWRHQRVSPRPNPLELAGSVASSMRRRRGQTIYEEDSPIEHLYRIVSGAAARFVLKPDGRWQIVALLLPKDVFGFGVGGKHCFAAAAVLNDTIVVRYPWARIEMLAGAARSGWWEPAG